ncbi:O-antigen ligase family protein [Bacillus sp. CHD6a]|uniref:O-antigen ligase family protein n=1 Tax=Bacillus sp. CHD6a TaxID=1643452 RepID=UPI0006CCF263|nr:O-antigen ligase family protein [Bacillus sp. CHD6a]KPB05731.1 hypothetical protein AAV98_05465 [Bacillus sp. CHD6a]
MIYLYFILLGFISAFSIDEWVPIPMLISSLLLVNLTIMTLKNNQIKLIKPNLLLGWYGFFIVLLLSFLLQIYSIGFQIKGFTHALSYFAIFFMYYFIVETSLKFYKPPIKKIFKYISLGVIFVSVFTIVEFISKNFLYIDFDRFIYRPLVQEYTAIYNFGGKYLYRARGTAEESGPMAMYLLMFLPFVVYNYKYFYPNKKKLLLSLIIILFALLTTFSAIGFFEMIVALIIVLLYFGYKKIKIGFTRKEYVLIYSITILSILMSFYFIFFNRGFNYLEGILNKITLSNSGSVDSRLDRWSFAWELIMEKPILGSGPGITAILNGTGSTSVYMEVLAEVGFIGFLLFILIFFITFISIFKLRGNIKLVYLFSFIVMITHLFVISQYWNPWIWALLTIINYNVFVEKKAGLDR